MKEKIQKKKEIKKSYKVPKPTVPLYPYLLKIRSKNRNLIPKNKVKIDQVVSCNVKKYLPKNLVIEPVKIANLPRNIESAHELARNNSNRLLLYEKLYLDEVAYFFYFYCKFLANVLLLVNKI